MSVKITTVAIGNELSPFFVDWLLANVGDKITIELSITVETTLIASIDNPITLQAQDGYIGQAWVVDPLGRFTDIKVGDSLYLYNYKTSTAFLGNPYTVLEKLSDSEIRLTNVGTLSGIAPDTESDYVLISLIKPITAMKYKYNFVENADQPTFLSKVDGTEQVLMAEGLDASDLLTVVPMDFIGAKPYQIGSATIKGDGLFTATGYQYRFKINHTTYITPFILSTQLAGLLTGNGVAPDYFFNQKCLKGIFDVEALYDVNDPNSLQTVEVTEVLGNTGWFDENFNTGLTNYYVDKVVYKRPDTSIITSIELSDSSETTVEVTVKNTVDSPFSNGNTKFVLNFCRIPFDESVDLDLTLNQQDNFLFDRKLQTLGSASVNGERFGTNYQVLKDIAATFISSSEIKITFKVSMVPNVVQVIGAMEEQRYLLWVAMQKHTLPTKTSDKVALRIDAAEFFTDTSDPGMIVATTKALRHPEDDILTQGVSFSAFSGGLEAHANFSDPALNTSMINSPFALVDSTNGFTIGITTIEIDINTALNKLVQSINTNTPLSYLWFASGYGVLPPFSNAAGYVASWDGITFKVKGPLGSGASFNTTDLLMVGRYAYYIERTFMSGGVDAVSSGLTVFPEDEVVFYSQFYIDKNGRTADDIKLKRITGKIKAKNLITLEEFTLDSFTNDLSNLPFIMGNQYISFEQDRVYHIPPAEIRKKVQIKRRADLDAAGLYYYDFILPELIRWEYWKKLALANADFFDTNEPNNGWNHFWHRYTTVTDWGLYYELEIKATKNGDALTYSFENKFLSTDYDTNPDWDPNTIKSYRDSDNTQLVSGPDNFILGYEATRIEAEFTKVSGTPVLANIVVVLRLEVFEEGGIEGQRRMSSKWPSDSDTWFISVDGSDKTKLSLSGNTVKAVALVDFTKIPLDKTRFKVTARLYDASADTDSKWFQDGNEFLFQDGDTYVFQDQ